jgi:cysteine desulfurase/selenocysteine lyase
MCHSQYGTLVLLDGCQSIPHIKINVEELDCDFFAFSGHKMLGPTGIGILYGKKDILENMAPYQTGGGMIEDVTMEKSTWTSIPHKFEAGSPTSAQAISLGYAIDYLNQIGDDYIETQKKLMLYALEKLNAINGITIYGNASERIPIISFNVDNIHSLDITQFLDFE